MQHDVGEYLGFLLPRLAWISNMVTWSCRLQAEDDVTQSPKPRPLPCIPQKAAGELAATGAVTCTGLRN